MLHVSMSVRPRIFISAVSKELRGARQLVANTLNFLGYEAVWQDIFGTEEGNLHDMLRRKIDTCQGLIQLVGQRFGFGPANPETDERAVSYTQFELRYARERRLKVWPIILATEFPTDAPNDEPAAWRENQERYRQSLAPSAEGKKPVVPIYHRAADSKELENLVLKLRNDFEILRSEKEKGQRRFRIAAGVVLCLLLILMIFSLALGRSIKNDTAQLKAVLSEYVQHSPAGVIVGELASNSSSDLLLLTNLEKKHGLPSGTLTNRLPRFGKKIAADRTVSAYERAQGAYAAKEYVEAERLALEAVAEAKKTLSLEKHEIVQALKLAGWSASKRRADTNALAHFTAAGAFIDKSRDPIEWADVNHAIAYVLFDLGDYFQAERVLREVVLLRTENLGSEDTETINSRVNLANTLLGQGKYANAEAKMGPLIKLLENKRGREDSVTLAVRNNFARALAGQGKSLEAEEEFRDVLGKLERVLGPEHQTTLRTRLNLDIAMTDQGKSAEAERDLRAVLKAMQRVLGPEHPDTLKAHIGLAKALDAQWKFGEAETELRSTIPVLQRVLGTEHPETLVGRNCFANALDAQGKSGEAEAEHRAILSVRERDLGSDHPDTLASRINVAAALTGQAKYAEAEVELRAVLERQEQAFGLEHRSTLKTRSSIAVLLSIQGKPMQAEAEFREILGLQERLCGAEHPDTLSTLYNLALCLANQRKLEEAHELACTAAERRQKVMGAMHPQTRKARDLCTKLHALIPKK